MLTIVLYKYNENKTFGTCSLSIIEIIDTQVARRGRQYHSQPSYKRQKLVPHPTPNPARLQKAKVSSPPKPPPKKSKIRKKTKNLPLLSIMTVIPRIKVP